MPSLAFRRSPTVHFAKMHYREPDQPVVPIAYISGVVTPFLAKLE